MQNERPNDEDGWGDIRNLEWFFRGSAMNLSLRSSFGLAGIFGNEFLAKMASGLNKANGMSLILPHEGFDFLAQLPNWI